MPIRFTRDGKEVSPEDVQATLFGEVPRPRTQKPLGEIKVCETGKHRFESAASAIRWLRNADLAKDRPKQPRRAYQCPYCGDWHLTSRPKGP